MKIKAHTCVEAVHSGLISADDRAGKDLADGACKNVVLSHRALPLPLAARRAADLPVTCIAHWIARVWSTRQRFDIDDVGFFL